MFQLLCCGILILLSAFTLADDLDKLNAKQQIIIGVRESSPPFSFFDKAKGKVSGYEIEFALYVARQLKLTPIFKTLEPQDRLLALHDGRVDILFATLAKDSDREKDLEFSIGYFVSTQKIVAKPGRFHSLAQLNSLAVCVPKGTLNAKYLKSLASNVQIVEFADYAKVFSALQSGACEYASGPETTMLGNLAQLPVEARSKLELAELPLAAVVYAAGVRKGEKRLQKAINTALIEAENTGVASQIFEHWFGAATPVPLNRNFKIMP